MHAYWIHSKSIPNLFRILFWNLKAKKRKKQLESDCNFLLCWSLPVGPSRWKQKIPLLQVAEINLSSAMRCLRAKIWRCWEYVGPPKQTHQNEEVAKMVEGWSHVKTFFSSGRWRGFACCQVKLASELLLSQSQCISFWAHAVHARGSDGHQNVLSLISYSHILENRWKQKARCLPDSKQTNPTKNKTKTNQEDTQGTRWDTTLSEKKSSGRSVLLHDVIANLANRCPKWLQVSKL